METRIGIEDPLFTTRNLLVIAVIVSAVTGGNLWLHRNDPVVGYARYTGFGITLDYSLLMNLQISGLGGLEPTESGGTVQATFQGDILEQYGVIWMTNESIPAHLRSLEGSLDYTFGIVGMEGTEITGRGPYEHMTLYDHETIYQTFNLMEQGFTIPGIIGVWYCNDAGKYIQFFLIYLSDFENLLVDPQELDQMWLGYLDLLRCH